VLFGSLAMASVAAFALVNVVDPYSGASAQLLGAQQTAYSDLPGQVFAVTSVYEQKVNRESFDFEKLPDPPKPVVTAAPSGGSSSSSGGGSGWAAPAGTPDPGSAQAIAMGYVGAGPEFDCLVELWTHESHWNTFAYNAGSGAYGIPQALPGSKMAAFGADWETNPDTQIRWGLSYINGRYGSPCGALGHWQSSGWY